MCNNYKRHQRLSTLLSQKQKTDKSVECFHGLIGTIVRVMLPSAGIFPLLISLLQVRLLFLRENIS